MQALLDLLRQIVNVALSHPLRAATLKKEIEFGHAFVKAGGLLMAGADPTGNGGALAGFADQRNIIPLVEAGFTPAEAIRIYTLNAAQYSGEADRIESIAEGKAADLVRVARRPGDLEIRIQNATDLAKAQPILLRSYQGP